MLEIKPTHGIDVTVNVPGSKSYTNRALITASLAVGESVIKNVLLSDDTRLMMACLKEVGVSIKSGQDDSALVIKGCGGAIPARAANLFAGNAGTVVRFMTAALTLGKGRYEIDGVERMRNRPIQELLNGLNQLGADVTSKETTGCPPVIINASGLKGGTIKMKGNVSSQYISAILLAAPYATNGVHIIITDELASKSYVDLTIEVMNRFGVSVKRDSYKELHANIWWNRTHQALHISLLLLL